MAQYDISLREYWRILRKRKVIVLSTAVILGFFSTVFAVIGAPDPTYTATCSIKFERETTVEGLYAKTITWSGGDDMETQISIIRSYSVFEKVAQKMGFVPPGGFKEEDPLRLNMVAAIEGLQPKVRVTRENLTNILNIEATDADPLLAQRLANTIALTYKELHSEQQMKRNTEAIKYIEDQLKDVRENLKDSEVALNKFSQENQLLSVDMQSERLLSRFQQLENDLLKLREDRRELQDVRARLERFIENPSLPGSNFYSEKAGAQYQGTNDSLVNLLLKRDTLLEDYTYQHPEVIDVGRKILETARKMNILLQLQMRFLDGREKDFKDALAELDLKSNQLMEKRLEYGRLKRKVDLYTDMTALLERKNQEALIRQAEKPEEVMIVRPALLPTSPTNPPRTAATGVVGVFVGIVLGLVAAFIVETFDTSLGAIEDVEATLKSQVLGVIPQTDPKDLLDRLEKKGEGLTEAAMAQKVNLITHFSPKSMIAESFRALRTNIQFKSGQRPIKSLAVASASPQEGKTLVSVNLAITMAQSGLKTLLVGSDMRKPMLDRVFGTEIGPGLSDVLLGNYAWRDTVKTITDLIMGKMSLDEVMMTPGLDNLHIITSGPIPPNPAELIESHRLRDFLEEAKKQYDLILFDSPPILSTADAAILGTRMDAVLLVYRVGTVSRGLLKRAVTQMEQVKCDILGVILNGMKPEISPDFHEFKYYKYYYSYGDEGKKRGERPSRIWSFLPGSADRHRRVEERPDALALKANTRRDLGKKRGTLGVSLLAIALLFLVGGILWQSGIIEPLTILRLAGTEEEPDTRIASTKDIPGPLSRGGEEKAKGPSGSGGLSEAGQTESVVIPAPAAVPRASQMDPDSANTKDKVATPAEREALAAPQAQAVAQEEKSVKEEARPPASVDSYPYSVFLYAFSKLNEAKRAVSACRVRGLVAYYVKTDLQEKGILFRVFLGHFRGYEEAKRFLKEKGLKGDIKRTQYVNLVGAYSNAQDLEKKKKQLEELGFSPYVIAGPEEKSRLFVGAFFTQEGAERHRQYLRSAGIEGEVVRR